MDTTENQGPETRPFGWPLWLQWVIGHFFSWVIGMSLFGILGASINRLTTGWLHTVGWGVAGIGVGFIFGLNQWFTFKPMRDTFLGRYAYWWLYATMLGWGVSLAVIIGMGAGDQFGFAVSGLIVGISVGIPQWFILYMQVRKAEWWAIGHTIAWVAGLAIPEYVDQALSFILAGVVSGVISGTVLIILLRTNFIALEVTESAQPPDG